MIIEACWNASLKGNGRDEGRKYHINESVIFTVCSYFSPSAVAKIAPSLKECMPKCKNLGRMELHPPSSFLEVPDPVLWRWKSMVEVQVNLPLPSGEFLWYDF